MKHLNYPFNLNSLAKVHTLSMGIMLWSWFFGLIFTFWFVCYLKQQFPHINDLNLCTLSLCPVANSHCTYRRQPTATDKFVGFCSISVLLLSMPVAVSACLMFLRTECTESVFLWSWNIRCNLLTVRIGQCSVNCP